MLKILLTGSSGQLGRNIIATAPSHIFKNEIEIYAPNRNELDLSNLQDCRKIILDYEPDYILNSAAYTSVDKAESEKEIVQIINYEAPKVFCEEILKIGGKFIQVSTDFVFDGNQNFPYKPSQKRNPINVYGNSKAKAEEAIEKLLNNTCQGLILRTGWLMGPYGNNFISTILNLNKTKPYLKVVNDQFGCPTSTASLANVCWRLIKKWEEVNKLPSIFHYSDSGVASWYDVAIEISRLGKELGLISETKRIFSIPTIEYKTPAKRPLYSVLDSNDIKTFLDLPDMNWKYTLKNTLQSMIQNK